MDISITATPDLGEIASIHSVCFDLPWNRQSMADVLAIAGTVAFVRQDKTGFAILRIVGDTAEIMTMAVLPFQRKQGIGSAMVLRMLEWSKEMTAQSMFLEVRKSNDAAKKLYEKFGFAEISRRKEYYHNADGTYEDAIVMKKSL